MSSGLVFCCMKTNAVSAAIGLDISDGDLCIGCYFSSHIDLTMLTRRRFRFAAVKFHVRIQLLLVQPSELQNVWDSIATAQSTEWVQLRHTFDA